MSANAVIPESVMRTHQDRPTPKRLLPIRVIPWMIGGKQGQALEYDTPTPQSANKMVNVVNTIQIDEPQPNCFSEPLHVFAWQVKNIMDAYWGIEAKVDGLLASIDQLTTDNLLKDREIEKLTNQLAEAKRSNGKKKEG